jgi:lysine 6-dehydrogenase
MNIAVLGSGMVGSAMALDLAPNHQVTIADINEAALNQVKSRNNDIHIKVLDVTNKAQLSDFILDFDLIVCAIPGFLGFETIKTIIENGKNLVDISFFPEDALELDSLAKAKGVTAIVDCGVAPGMHNLILGYYNELMNISSFECLVGGLPKVKTWPFYYKAPFSPIDVIEEYTRPARYIENGKLVTREALSDCEYVEFNHVGTLESFNTDGLRSIIHTMPHIPDMKEKTLRYPGHVEFIKALKKSGFFNTEKIHLTNAQISPMEFTAKILFDAWKLGEEEEEITVMRVTLKGNDKISGEEQTIIYNLYDEYCPKTKTSSMARTTGYTATAAVNLIDQGIYKETGVFPPELVGKYKVCFEFILDYLNQKGIVYELEVR